MLGMRSLGFQRSAWSVPLKIWRCSAMDATTISSDEPRDALSNTPDSISLAACRMPWRMDRKLVGRKGHKIHVWKVPAGLFSSVRLACQACPCCGGFWSSGESITAKAVAD